MAIHSAFNPTGPTVKVAADTTAPLGVQALSVGAPKANQYRIHNSDTVEVFFAFGVDAATAQANAVIPTGSGANSKNSYPIAAGATEYMTAPLDCFWSAIVAVTAGALYVTPGEGGR